VVSLTATDSFNVINAINSCYCCDTGYALCGLFTSNDLSTSWFAVNQRRPGVVSPDERNDASLKNSQGDLMTHAQHVKSFVFNYLATSESAVSSLSIRLFAPILAVFRVFGT